MPSMVDPRDAVRTTQNLTMQEQFNKDIEKKKKKAAEEKSIKLKRTLGLGKLKAMIKGIDKSKQADVNAAGNTSPGDGAKSVGNAAIGGVKWEFKFELSFCVIGEFVGDIGQSLYDNWLTDRK